MVVVSDEGSPVVAVSAGAVVAVMGAGSGVVPGVAWEVPASAGAAMNASSATATSRWAMPWGSENPGICGAGTRRMAAQISISRAMAR